MANNITNVLEFTGNQKDINALLKSVKKTVKGEVIPFDFEKIIPMPKGTYRGNLGEKEREKYGSNNWFDWSVVHWGTKWNAYCVSRNDNTIKFDTAWNAPMPVFHELVKMIAEKKMQIDFEVTFASEDIGNATGYYIYLNGKSDFGHFEDESNEAFEAFIKCNGKSDCISFDSDGTYSKYHCNTCPHAKECGV